jgi:hypothetical protein
MKNLTLFALLALASCVGEEPKEPQELASQVSQALDGGSADASTDRRVPRPPLVNAQQ